MGLNRGDLERVPEGMGAEECYARIYNWHKRYGKSKVAKIGLPESYVEKYLLYLDEMPAPDIVSIEEMQKTFRETIINRLEWSYHKEDQYGIKIAAYAHHGKKLLG